MMEDLEGIEQLLQERRSAEYQRGFEDCQEQGVTAILQARFAYDPNTHATNIVSQARYEFMRVIDALTPNTESKSDMNAASEIVDEIERLREALMVVAHTYGLNPSDTMAELPEADYLALVLAKLRKLARETLDAYAKERGIEDK